MASIASMPKIPCVTRLPSGDRNTDISDISDIRDIRVTSQTFNAGNDGRTSLTWDITQLIMTCLKRPKRVRSAAFSEGVPTLYAFPLLKPLESMWLYVVICGYMWFRY